MSTTTVVTGLFFRLQTDNSVPIAHHNAVYSQLVPLKSVQVHAELVDSVSKVRIEQTYRNAESRPIEAVYKFPVHESAAICGFKVEIDGRIVVGVVKEKETAAKVYDEAVAAGHGAYLLEEQKPDIFQMTVGNIPPEKEVKITISYVAEMLTDSGEEDQVRFVVPTTIAPRYAPAASNPGTKIIGGDNPTYDTAGGAAYAFKIDVQCQMTGEITAVESPSHPIKVSLHGGGSGDVSRTTEGVKTRAVVHLALEAVNLDKDFVLVVNAKGLDSPRAVLESHKPTKTNCAMLTMVPRFALNEVLTEIIFVIDRSGSMEGRKIEDAKSALRLFLKSIPETCYFNIIGFGNDFRSLFPNSEKYSSQSLKQALQHVATIEADLGGTELLKPLQNVFASPTIPGAQRCVFLMTDGEVGNTDQVVEEVRQAQSKTGVRAFTLGIGNAVSQALVSGIARAGRGDAQYILKGERMEKKVIAQLKMALLPSVKNLKVEWCDATHIPKRAAEAEPRPVISFFSTTPVAPPDKLVPEPGPVQQAPYHDPPLYPGSRFVIYAFLKDAIPAPSKIVVSGTSPDGPMRLEIPISETITGDLVHTLAARRLIQDLEEGKSYLQKSPEYAENSRYHPVSQEMVRKEIVSLSMTFSVMSRFTSYIAVDEREGAEVDMKVKPVTRVVPALPEARSGAGNLCYQQPQMAMHHSMRTPGARAVGGISFGSLQRMPAPMGASAFGGSSVQAFRGGWAPSMATGIPTCASPLGTATGITRPAAPLVMASTALPAWARLKGAPLAMSPPPPPAPPGCEMPEADYDMVLADSATSDDRNMAASAVAKPSLSAGLAHESSLPGGNSRPKRSASPSHAVAGAPMEEREASKKKRAADAAPPKSSPWPTPSASRGFAAGAAAPGSRAILSESSLSTPPQAQPTTGPNALDPLSLLASFVSLQDFDGSFPLNEALVAAIGIGSVASLRKFWEDRSGGNKEYSLCGTALVLAALEEHCAALKDEWVLIWEKAKKWFKKRCGQEGLQDGPLLEAARTVVKAGTV